MAHRPTHLFTALSISALLALSASPTRAQIHHTGSAWIMPDAPTATWVHLEDDPFCVVEFEDHCYGGMMAPDSVLCVVEPLAPAEWPDECPVALVCTATDPDGGRMFDGGGMPGGMMRRDVTLVVHYDPDLVGQMGLDPAGLCLVRLDGSGPTVLDAADHDLAAATFTLATSAPTAAWAVVPRSTLVDAARTSTSALKSRY